VFLRPKLHSAIFKTLRSSGIETTGVYAHGDDGAVIGFA
jgi:hypothetical protein